MFCFMPRFFIFKDLNIGEHTGISGEEAHHIARVLRYKKGDIISISDGKNIEYTGLILDIDIKGPIIEIEIIDKKNADPIRPYITLYCGLPKGEKFEWILQKNTEIGVSEFVPMITERTVANIMPSKSEFKLARWSKIVQEAAKQCMRINIPEVREICDFDTALSKTSDCQLTIIPWENERETSLKDVLKYKGRDASKVAVFIGPEGGFSEKEIEKAVAIGATPVSLGPRILRTETASFAVSSIIMYEIGDIGGR